MKGLLTSVSNMEADEAKKYMEKHTAGSFILLDVRQPAEYKDVHIPGAKLIPLPELSERTSELDTEKPVIVYCAAGGRSRVAAQYLQGKGFKTVHNLNGGMMAWEGREAEGLPDMGMQMLRGDETLQDIIRIAYSQEHGLAVFYLTMIPLISDAEVAGVFNLLADIEDKHKRKLFETYKTLDASANREQFEKSMSDDMMEGGWKISEFIAQHTDSVRKPADAINIAMMIEAQAFDVYLRYADKSQNADVRKILFDLANEEKAHLKRLGNLMEEKYNR